MERFILYPAMPYRVDAMPFHDLGFGTFRGHPEPPTGHVHESIELSAFEGGPVEMLYGGQRVRVPAGRLVLHWGMLPHRAIRHAPDVRVVGVHLPLVWLLQWDLSPGLVGRLLNMEFLVEPRRVNPCTDLALLKSWHALDLEFRHAARKAILADILARLHCLALTSRTADNDPSVTRSTHPFHRALRLVATDFREAVRMEAIAKEAGVSVRQLTRLFREHSGRTFHGYLLGLRLAHAQLLLASTNRTVTDVLFDSGFSCATQFYRSFRDRTGFSPREFRIRQAGGRNAGPEEKELAGAPERFLPRSA